MTKKFKQTLAIMCAAILLFGNTAMVHAQTSEDSEEENYGVTDVCPDPNDDDLINEENTNSTDTSTPIMKSVKVPTDVWNVKEKGKRIFLGSSSDGKTLYSDHKFTGKTSYTIYVKNTGKKTLTVKAKRATKTYVSSTIDPGKAKTLGFQDIKSDTKFYLTFKGSSFSGYIK